MDRLTGHTELQDLLGAYALDAVEAEEAAAVELHLASCPRCRNELAEHREVAALLGYTGGPAPQGVWDRIVSGMEEPPPPFDLDLPRPRTPFSLPSWMPTSAGSTLANAWHALGSRSTDAIQWHGLPQPEGGADVDEVAEFRRQARALLGPSTPTSLPVPSPPPTLSVPSAASSSPTPPMPLLTPARLLWEREPLDPPGEDALVLPMAAYSAGPRAGVTPPASPQGPGPGSAGPSAGGPRHYGSAADGGRRSGRSVPMRWMVAIAATAAVLVAALGIEIGRLETGNKSKPQDNLAYLAFQVAQANPGARHLTLRSANGAVTVLAVVLPDGETYLGTSNLEVLPSSETYQMWGLVGGADVSLGVIGDDASYASFSTPTAATVLAMTVEAQGGVVTTSNTPVVEGAVPT